MKETGFPLLVPALVHAAAEVLVLMLEQSLEADVTGLLPPHLLVVDSYS